MPILRRTLISSLTLAALCFPSLAHAQIVNVQSALATEAKEGISGSVTASADWRTGNTDLLLLGLQPVARFRAGDHLTVGILRGEYGESRDATIAKKAFGHLRHRYAFHDRVLAEVFAQAEYDEIRLLKLRSLFGIGPKVDLVKQKRILLSLGVAYMLEHERPSADAQETENTTLHRGSSYLTGRFAVDEKVQLIETVYVQPRLDDFGDIRVLSESQLMSKIAKTVSLKTSFVVAYDSSPLTKSSGEQLDELDTTLKTSITVDF